MRQSPQEENYQRVARLLFLTLSLFFGHVASAQSDMQVESTVPQSTTETCNNIPKDAALLSFTLTSCQ